jgi:hypothetical protein
MVRRWGAALTVGVLAVAASYFLAGISTAEPRVCSNFSGVAAAQGVQEEVSNTGYVVNTVAADIPAAQAFVNSQGLSSAYAAEPYPGGDALSLFGLAGLPQSTYPAVAQSSYPAKPQAEVSSPGVSLSAVSHEFSSLAAATSGAAQGAADVRAGVLKATAKAGCADGTVTAKSESDDEGFSLAAGLLRIGRLHSLAQVITGPDGVPHLTSTLDVGQLTVAGQTVELNSQGLLIGGSTRPLPASDPLTRVLATAGIKVTYLAATTDRDGKGIVSAGLSITTAAQGQGSGPTTETYVLGQAHARGDVIVPDASASGSSPAASPSSANAGPTGRAAVSVSAPASSLPGTTSAARPLGTIQPSVGAPLGPPGARARSASSLASFSWEAPYLGIVVGACVLFGSLTLVRILGVKTTWI